MMNIQNLITNNISDVNQFLTVSDNLNLKATCKKFLSTVNGAGRPELNQEQDRLKKDIHQLLNQQPTLVVNAIGVTRIHELSKLQSNITKAKENIRKYAHNYKILFCLSEKKLEMPNTSDELSEFLTKLKALEETKAAMDQNCAYHAPMMTRNLKG